jgi:two-component system, OmpR family, sensor kinase
VSLRLKLLIAVIVLVFAGLAVADVITYTSLRTFVLRRVDQQLVAGRGLVLQRVLTGGGDPFHEHGDGPDSALIPGGTYGEVRDGRGNVVGRPVTFGFGTAPPAPTLPSRLPRAGAPAADPDIFSTGATGGSSLRYRVLVQPFADDAGNRYTLVVAIPLSDVDPTLHRLVLIEALVTGAVVLGLGLLFWWLVRRELRPLEEIGTTAGAIAAGDLSRRVAQEDPRTEIGRLGLSLNAMLAQIERAFAERRASEDRLRRFLADASHELRTPLTSIRGYAELFRRGAGERQEDLAKSMRRIEDESARMGVMVEELLLLARLDQDRPLEREPVDLAALAFDAAQDAGAAAPDRRIEVEAPVPVPVLGDEARLRQVTANLLANAVVHTPPGTPVTVRARTDGDEGVLEVADRGPGLSSEEAERAFEPFYRSDPSRDRSTGGAGLGLAIVAAIAKAHGGRVDVASTPGGGATFRVLIPRQPAMGPGGRAEGNGRAGTPDPAPDRGPEPMPDRGPEPAPIPAPGPGLA